MVSPSRSRQDGSPTRHQSRASPRAARASTTLTVPSVAMPSSSLVMRKAMDPRCPGWARTKPSVAVTMAAMDPFMSAAPRP